jgi:hypothetical protein
MRAFAVMLGLARGSQWPGREDRIKAKMELPAKTMDATTEENGGTRSGDRTGPRFKMGTAVFPKEGVVLKDVGDLVFAVAASFVARIVSGRPGCDRRHVSGRFPAKTWIDDRRRGRLVRHQPGISDRNCLRYPGVRLLLPQN